MPEKLLIRGERLLTALNFLEYLAEFFVERDDGFRYPTDKNPWDFTADGRRLNCILRDGFGRDADPDDPRDEDGVIGEWNLPTYYAGSCWPAFHAHLEENIERLGSIEIDVTSYLRESTDVVDEIGCFQIGDGVKDANAFGRFLKMMASGELAEHDLAALDTDEPID